MDSFNVNEVMKEREISCNQLKLIKESDNLKYLKNQVFYEAIKEGIFEGKKDSPKEADGCGVENIYQDMSEEEIFEEVFFQVLSAGNMNEDPSDRLSVYMEGVSEEEIAPKLKEFFKSLQIKRCQRDVDWHLESLERKKAAAAAAALMGEEESEMDIPLEVAEIQRRNIEASDNLEYLDNPLFYGAIKEGVIKGYRSAGMDPPENIHEDIVMAILFAGNYNDDKSKHLSKYMENVPEGEIPQKLKEFFESIQLGLLKGTHGDLEGGGLAFQKMRKRSRKTKSKRRKSKRRKSKRKKSKRRKSKTRRRRR
jgi:hypothetical protein